MGEYNNMKHNKHARRVWIFYTYDAGTDKTTITDGNSFRSFTGYNLPLFVKMFKASENITKPAALIRY